MGDSVVRDAAQIGLDEDQPIEQPDHRNGDHNQEQLHCADDQYVELRTLPRGPMCETDRAEDAHGLVSGLGGWPLFPELAYGHLHHLG
jgi:hypothetical protein